MYMVIPQLFWQDYGKRGALICPAIGKNIPMMVVNDLFADRKPYARTLVIRSVKPLKYPKYLLTVLLVKTYTVVFYGDANIFLRRYPQCTGQFCTYLSRRNGNKGRVIFIELYGV